jgi:CHAD domain-containing protein
VFITQTLPPILLQLHDQPRLILLNKEAEHTRQKAYAAMRAALSSQRYHRLLLTLGDWLENERWHDSKAVECTVFDIAKSMLAKYQKQLKQHGQRLMQAHPEERHATRIAAKKLRYATEFFASLYPEARLRDYLSALTKLLDNLGTLNDIAVTESLIRCLIGEHPKPVLDEALYLFTGWNACNAMHYKQDLERCWNHFSHQKPP